MRRALIPLALGLLLAGAFGLGFALSDRRPAPAASRAPRTSSIVAAVRSELAARYYRAVPQRVLELRSVRSMLAALDDPYTEYLSKPAYRLLQRELAGRYTGIGVTLLPSPAGLLVVAAGDGPGLRAGLRPGDVIVRIGPTSALRLGLAGALARISGRSGTIVRLSVRRGTGLLELAVRRGHVQAPTISSRLVSLDGRSYAYVDVSAFRSGTAADVALVLRRLLRAGAAGVVLDLRENPGGLLDEAVGVSSLFLARGRVVTLIGAHRPRVVYSVSGHPVAPTLPLAVLVDRYSASSAEVVAAALHDNRRALLVGGHTFGKAVVQTIDPLANGGALALTTARYFTPAGADISRRGVGPDVPVANDPRTPIDEVLAAALAALASSQS